MRVLVLGGLGFVGRAVCSELDVAGADVITASRAAAPPAGGHPHLRLDRQDQAEFRRVLAEVRPEVLVDLACYQPAEVDAVVHSFTGARYLFMSTGVYPDLFGRTAAEEDFVPLVDPVPQCTLEYMDAKRWCETVLSRHQEFAWTVIRPPAIFGPHDPSLRIVAYIARILDGGPLLVPAESYEWRVGCAWVRDVGRATARACELGRSTDHKAYNVSLGDVTFRQLLEAFARGLDRPLRLLPVPYADVPRTASPYGPNPSRGAGYHLARARQELDFEPSALDAAVADTLDWYHREHPSDPDYGSRDEELALAQRLEEERGTIVPAAGRSSEGD